MMQVPLHTPQFFIQVFSICSRIYVDKNDTFNAVNVPANFIPASRRIDQLYCHTLLGNRHKKKGSWFSKVTCMGCSFQQLKTNFSNIIFPVSAPGIYKVLVMQMQSE